MRSSIETLNYWLKEIVIGLDLCPFARIPFKKGLIRVVECLESDEAEMINFFIEELDFLNEKDSQEVSTTIISYPHDNQRFLEFNDFVGDLEYLMEEAGLETTFQLVCFHPEFCFKGESFDSRSNLVNRSPYNVIHILRTADFKMALSNPKDGEIISRNNEEKLNEFSDSEINKLFYYLK